MVWENQRVFMKKEIHKAIMVRNNFFRKNLHLADNHMINKEITE